uniref:Putative alcohol dehydrogenase superfamily, zinc-type, GroES-like, NAD(P)-binding domain protein n=1 Tax=Helianthus annuus TaxID=4232 RepID=A0A251U5M1_HELAN
MSRIYMMMETSKRARGKFKKVIVESVGEGVHEVVEGDTMIPIFLADCGECTDCLSEKSNLCTKFPLSPSPWMKREDTSRFTDINGETLYHFLSVSNFSEYTVVDIAHLTKTDPAISPNRACLLSCGVSTRVGAAWKTAKVEAGTTVAIFELGIIMEMTGGGADYCFACVGMNSLVHEAYASCRKVGFIFNFIRLISNGLNEFLLDALVG